MTSSDLALRPQPVPDELTAPFWSAAANHKLAIQRCGRCTKFQHPPAPRCRHCGERDLVFEEVSGRGSIYSTCRMWIAAVPGFSLPYVVLTVQLVEQPDLLLTSNWSDETAPDIGTPVEVAYERRGSITLPQFAPLGARR